jgi:signal transduction histidine kinase
MNIQKLLKNVLEKEEHYRKLIAYEIHDGISQYLSAAIMHLEAYKANPSDNLENDPNMTGALRLLREASRETRHLISGLRPPALDELGIIDSLEMLIADARLEIQDIEFRHNLHGKRLPTQIEVSLFRISQESLTNIRKHSKANQVRVELIQEEAGTVSLTIYDDGCGFDSMNQIENCFGLEGIHQRAIHNGGTASIQSLPANGTTVCVSFPAPSHEAPASYSADGDNTH